MGKGQGNEQMAQGGSGNRMDDNTNVTSGGPRRNVADASQYIGLPERDRAALRQSQNEKYPEEYGPAVEQYLRNLAEPEQR